MRWSSSLATVILLSTALTTPALARPLMPEKPSIEVNYDVLQQLSQPAIPFESERVEAAPLGSSPVRKLPAEQPSVSGWNPNAGAVNATDRARTVATRIPGMPFSVGESAAARLSDVSSRPKAETPVRLRPVEQPAARTTASTTKPTPAPKTTPVTTPKAPAPKPAPKVEAAPPKPAPALPEVKEPAPLPPPAPAPALPEVKEPAPLPPPKPDKVEPPAPDISALDFSKLPITPVLPPKPAAPEIPAVALAGNTPVALPSPPNQKDVLVVAPKDSAAPLPPPPELPAVTPETAPESSAGLLPSISSRVSNLFAKNEVAPSLGDKTAVINPAAPADLPKKPESNDQNDLAILPPSMQLPSVGGASNKQDTLLQTAAKPASPAPIELPPPPKAEPATTRPLAKAKEEKTEDLAGLPPPPKMELPAMPAPTLEASKPKAEPIKLPEEAKVAALPKLDFAPEEVKAPEKPALAPPALPSLDAITGDGDAPSSLEIVDPKEGIETTDMLPPASLPLEVTPEKSPSLPPAPLPVVKTEAKPKQEATKELDVAALPAAVPPAPAPATNVKPEAPKPAAPATPALAPQGDATASLAFSKDATDLSESAKAELNNLAKDVLAKGSSVRIVAYAAGSAEQASVARRVSLSRALQVRAFLIDKGVDQLRINVQAQGNKVPSGNADRADIFVR
jgi:outer membrane protein OmpA-like peptidoglycan-associated protein